MADFSFGDLSKALSETEGSGVSFESQANNWGTEDEARNVIEAINNCKVLEYLKLEGNTLGVDAARGIGEALKKHPEFRKALFKDLFTGRLKTEIPKALEYLGKGMILAGAKLSVLDCSDNALGPNGMVGLIELLKSPTCFSLQELKLNNCGLGIGGGKMLAQALLDCHAASVKAGTPLQLKVFIAGRNRLENDGAKALARVFEVVETLEEIAIPQNGIYHVGISALSEGFRLNPNMRILNLNDNTVGPKGAESIAYALETMQKLEEINLGDCLLKTKGAVLLGEALQEGHLSLENLNLSFNEIGPIGGYNIAYAMFNKEHLQNLNLNGNQFGKEAREQIKGILVEGQRSEALDDLNEDDSEGEEEEDDDGDDEEDEDDEDSDEDDDDYTDEVDDDEYVNVTNSQNQNSTAEINDLSINSNDFNNSSIQYVGEIDRPNTVETFFNTPHPTETQFNALEDNDKIFAFRNYLKTIPEKEYLTSLVFAILKCSAISQQSKDALDVSTALYKDCYEFALKTSQLTRVNTFFLTQLGLLKTEDKSFKPAYDLKACRSAIQHAIKLKVFTDEVADAFNLFLERFQ